MSDQPGDPDCVVYLFGIGRDELELSDVPVLLGGRTPRTVAAAGLHAVVCDVDVATFEAIADANPASLDLLAATARAHDTTLARVAAVGPILPLRLGTSFADDDAVRMVLRRHAAALHDELDRLAGHSEWAVTVHLLPDDQRDHARKPHEPAATGREYLEQRRAALDARNQRWEARERVAATIHEALANHVAAADRVRARLLDNAAPRLLHGVYLLADRHRDE